ncbi:MAG: DUF4917 family protein [Dehalococcoidia bacterium]|nr:DUF4917 family protein [Dehalococcoidia bacterium]
MEPKNWDDIATQNWDTLLLGNGATIAVAGGLGWENLYDAAQPGLTRESKELFSKFDTHNFEQVLGALQVAHGVNEALGVSDAIIGDAYEEIKEALIAEVRERHPSHETVYEQLEPIARFMAGFKTVYSLNYDLVVYWAVLVGNDCLGRNRLKDCWTEESGYGLRAFPADHSFLRTPVREGTSCTLVFYPHGHLALCADAMGNEYKIQNEHGTQLLDRISEAWDTGQYHPLFVSEGSSQRKLEAILQSPYLKTVYSQELVHRGTAWVVFGWRADLLSDQHIFDAIVSAAPTSLALAVHEPTQKKCAEWEAFGRTVEEAVRKKHKDRNKKIRLELFNADSVGCWDRSTSLE